MLSPKTVKAYHKDTVLAGDLEVIVDTIVRLVDERLDHLVHYEDEVLRTEPLGAHYHLRLTGNTHTLMSVIKAYGRRKMLCIDFKEIKT